jgi:hypothetical protein
MPAGSLKLEKRYDLVCLGASEQALVPPYSHHRGSRVLGGWCHMINT